MAEALEAQRSPPPPPPPHAEAAPPAWGVPPGCWGAPQGAPPPQHSWHHEAWQAVHPGFWSAPPTWPAHSGDECQDGRPPGGGRSRSRSRSGSKQRARPKTEKELALEQKAKELRAKLLKAKEEKIDKLRDEMKSALEAGDVDLAAQATRAILATGSSLRREVLIRLLEVSVANVGSFRTLLALLNSCAIAKLKLRPDEYAVFLGTLMARRACTASVRLLLNVALPRGSEPLELVLEDTTEEEKHDAFQDVLAVPEIPETADGDSEEKKQEDGEEEPIENGATIPAGKVLYLPEFIRGKRVIVRREDDTFLVDNSELNSVKKAMKFRRSAKMNDHSAHSIAFGTTINGQLGDGTHVKSTLDNGWLRLALSRASETASEEPVSASTAEAGTSNNIDEILGEVAKVQLVDLQGMLESPGLPGAADYFGHFIALLHLERLAELGNFQRRFRRSPVERLVKSGHTLSDLEVKSTYGRRENSSRCLPGWPDTGSENVDLTLPPGTDDKRLRIRKGECIILSLSNPVTDAIAEGFVSKVSSTKLSVSIAGSLTAELKKKRLRVDVYANKVVYERQLMALLQVTRRAQKDPLCKLLVTAKVGQLDSWAEGFVKARAAADSGCDPEDIAQDSSKDDVLPSLTSKDRPPKADEKLQDGCAASEDAGKPSASEEAAAAAAAADPAAEKEAEVARSKECVELAGADPNSFDEDAVKARKEKIAGAVADMSSLNSSQRAAVAAAVLRRCAIVQGPPGTGKTHVSVKVIHTWIKSFGLFPILATSDSNAAVDNIAEGLHRAGIKVVRVGRAEKSQERLEAVNLDSMVAQKKRAKDEASGRVGEGEDVEGGKPDSKRRKLDETNLEDKRDENGEADGEGAGKGKGKSKGKGKKGKSEDQIIREIRNEVLEDAEVICITTMSSGGDVLRDFNFKATLIDEVAQATETSTIVPVVLRGTKQLVLVGDHCQLPPSVISREAELRGLSLSLYQRFASCDVEPFFLDTQYRSHPQLAAFSSKVFYQDRLKSDVAEHTRPMVRGVPWPNPKVPVAFFEVRSREIIDQESKANPKEADRLVDLVEEVLRAGELGVRDIGVVTPYMAQVRLLRRVISERLPRDQAKSLEVASVDNFQGREKELIMFSAVRNNRFGNVGFLADWRRLNVMLTRARRGLVIFGSENTLRCDTHWEQWLDWCQSLEAAGSAVEATDRGWAEQSRNSRMSPSPDWEEGQAWQRSNTWHQEEGYEEPWEDEDEIGLDSGKTPSPFANDAAISSPFETKVSGAAQFGGSVCRLSPFASSSAMSAASQQAGSGMSPFASAFSTTQVVSSPFSVQKQIDKKVVDGASPFTSGPCAYSARKRHREPWEHRGYNDSDVSEPEADEPTLSADAEYVSPFASAVVKAQVEQTDDADSSIDALCKSLTKGTKF